VTTGPSGQRLGAGGSEREQGSAVRGADWRPRQHSADRLGFKPDSNRIQLFKTVQTDSKLLKLWLTQKCFPVLQKWEIKYGLKEDETGNNFVYRRFLRFSMDFELKIRELLGVKFQYKFTRNSWDFRI
jgi:hypothetical protein